VDYIHSTHVRDQTRAVLNIVLELHKIYRGICLMAGPQSASQKGLCFIGFSYQLICNTKKFNEWKSC
jgi:hypothetical protein